MNKKPEESFSASEDEDNEVSEIEEGDDSNKEENAEETIEPVIDENVTWKDLVSDMW